MIFWNKLYNWCTCIRSCGSSKSKCSFLLISQSVSPVDHGFVWHKHGIFMYLDLWHKAVALHLLCLYYHVSFIAYYVISLQFCQEFNDISLYVIISHYLTNILTYFIEILYKIMNEIMNEMIYSHWVLLIFILFLIAFITIIIVQNDKWKAS